MMDMCGKNFEKEIVLTEAKRKRVSTEMVTENQETESGDINNINGPKNGLEAGAGLQTRLEQ